PIAGANARSYTLRAGDLGARLRVIVVASNAAGSSAPARSAPSAVVSEPPGDPPLPVPLPNAPSSVARRAAHGSWSGTPTSYAYRWRRCDASGTSCAPIAGANARSYTLRAGDLGARLRVIVVASNAAGSSAPARSAPSAVVSESPGEPPVNVTLPQVS